ncbi:MAG: glycosyltransferase family 39 protein [Gemmatimonadaceae bacterium]|nr:glycosyltransferase family 39 protein [Gemmatimonadaceae bacterium]
MIAPNAHADTSSATGPIGGAALVRAAPYLVLVLVVCHAIVAWLMRTPGFGWGEDDSGYLLLGQQLRHFSYREVQDVLAPVHARFPPVFPAMLAVVGAVFGDQLDVLFSVVALASAGSVFLLYSAARRVAGEELALLATLLYAINPSALADGGTLMAEAPFKLFVMLALWALTREDEGPRFAIIAGVATCLAALTRTAGVVFVPALVGYWLVNRQYRRALIFSVAALATVGLWIGFTFAAPDPDNRRLYIADLGARGRRAQESVLHTTITRLLPRMRRYLTTGIPTVLSFPTIERVLIDNVVWLVSTVVFGVTGFVVLLRRWRGAAAFLLAYGLLLMVWRYALDRFLHPIVPLLYFTLLLGAWWLGSAHAPRARPWLLATFVGLVAWGSLRTDARLFQRAMACDRANPAGPSTCWPIPERNYLRLANWVRDSTPPDAIFFVSKERAFYMHAGRKSINQDRGLQEDSVSLGDFLRARGVSYATVTPVGVRSGPHNRLVAAACREFSLVRRFSEQTMLLRVRAPGESSATDDACAALAVWSAPRQMRK